jgi:hypothetical protein
LSFIPKKYNTFACNRLCHVLYLRPHRQGSLTFLRSPTVSCLLPHRSGGRSTLAKRGGGGRSFPVPAASPGLGCCLIVELFYLFGWYG